MWIEEMVWEEEPNVEKGTFQRVLSWFTLSLPRDLVLELSRSCFYPDEHYRCLSDFHYLGLTYSRLYTALLLNGKQFKRLEFWPPLLLFSINLAEKTVWIMLWGKKITFRFRLLPKILMLGICYKAWGWKKDRTRSKTSFSKTWIFIFISQGWLKVDK